MKIFTADIICHNFLKNPDFYNVIDTLTLIFLLFAEGPASSWSRDGRLDEEAILEQIR